MFKKLPKIKLRSTGIFFVLIASMTLSTTTACNRKSGCPVNEDAHVKPGRDGTYKKSKGKSNLFPKHMRRG